MSNFINATFVVFILSRRKFMPKEHVVMTVQSIWNREPPAVVTAAGILETDGMTAQEVYEQAHQGAMKEWRRQYPSTNLGKAAVLFYSREPNSPELP
jgi:hypothetical protein